jgi:hypothetical protein
MGLQSWNATWFFMTHGTFIQSVDGDGSTFIIIITYAVGLFKTETPINCMKAAAVCT